MGRFDQANSAIAFNTATFGSVGPVAITEFYSIHSRHDRIFPWLDQGNHLFDQHAGISGHVCKESRTYPRPVFCVHNLASG